MKFIGIFSVLVGVLCIFSECSSTPNHEDDRVIVKGDVNRSSRKEYRDSDVNSQGGDVERMSSSPSSSMPRKASGGGDVEERMSSSSSSSSMPRKASDGGDVEERMSSSPSSSSSMPHKAFGDNDVEKFVTRMPRSSSTKFGDVEVTRVDNKEDMTAKRKGRRVKRVSLSKSRSKQVEKGRAPSTQPNVGVGDREENVEKRRVDNGNDDDDDDDDENVGDSDDGDDDDERKVEDDHHRLWCAPGFELDNHGSCRPCRSGYYRAVAVAPAHSKLKNSNQSLPMLTCQRCPGGRFSARVGSNNCSPCGGGEVSHAGDTQCVLCPGGHIAAKSHDRCLPCTPGKWSIAGDEQCRVCPPGTYNGRMGAAGCVDCGRGRFNVRSGSTHESVCRECVPGSMCQHTANAVPIPCDNRHFAPKGSHICLGCPSMFVSSPNRDRCIPTPMFRMLVLSIVIATIVVIVFVLKCPRRPWHQNLDGL